MGYFFRSVQLTEHNVDEGKWVLWSQKVSVSPYRASPLYFDLLTL